MQAVHTTGNQTQVAHTFRVGRSTVKRLLKLAGSDPDLTPKVRPGRQRAIAPQHYPALLAILNDNNDLTLEHLAQRWAQQQQSAVPLSQSTLSRLLSGWVGPEKKEPGSHRA